MGQAFGCEALDRLTTATVRKGDITYSYDPRQSGRQRVSAPLPLQMTRSVFVYPTNGMTDVNRSQAFQWTTVPDAGAYSLYVGTTPGANNLMDTGEIQETSYTAASLPAGTPLYGRIWTQYADQWSSSDISFSGTNPATFIYPTNGTSNVDLSQPFQWTAVSGAQAYYLYVGTSVGLKDLVDTGEIQQTSHAAPTLPANQTLYARIWTELGGVWLSADITFSAAARATLTFPANGAVNADLSHPIQWTAVPGAQAYYLYVGTAVGLHNLVDTGEIQPTSYLASGIPANQTVYARMWTETGGVWRYADSTFSGFTKSSFVYPPNGATNVDVNIPIQWTSAPGAQAYVLYVGTTPGAKNLVETNEFLQTSYTAANLPPNQTVYARIWTEIAGGWYYTDETFFVPSRATFISPTNGASNVNLTPAFQWTSAPGAQAYVLYVGTTPGASNLVQTNEFLQTSYTASNLPAGQPLYARIWTEIGGSWYYSAMSFTGAPSIAALVAPVNGATNVSTSTTFQWTSVPNAQAYYLYVGTAVGTKDVVDSYETQLTSRVAANMPANRMLYSRIWTELNGTWTYNDSTFTTGSGASGIATLTAPVNGATGVPVPTTFHWTAIAGAQAYVLYVGTTLGAKNLVETNEFLQTSYTASNLPAGQLLYARIWTELAGAWYHADSSFTTTGGSPGCQQTPNGNDMEPDDDSIQCLLDQGGTVTLDADVSNGYFISRGLVLRRNGTVLTSSSAAGFNALLQATATLHAPILQVESEAVSNYTIEKMFFWGSKFTRPCNRQADIHENVNVRLRGGPFTIDNIESDAAPCGSSTVVDSTTHDFEIKNSWFANNGFQVNTLGHDGDWSDGLTVHACQNGRVHDNNFRDNTDVDLIFGGTRRDEYGQADAQCLVYGNHISHIAAHGFAGLMVGFFGNALNTAEHAGAEYLDNTVSSASDMLAFGVMVGNHPWDVTTWVKNVNVHGNQATGAVVNLAIDGITSGLVQDQTVSAPRGTQSYPCPTTAADYTAYDYGPSDLQAGFLPRNFHGGDPSCGR